VTYLIILLFGGDPKIDQPPPIEFADLAACKRALEIVIGGSKAQEHYKVRGYCAQFTGADK
jgi:hypothetical protein